MVIKLKPENKFERGVELLFERFVKEEDFNRSIETLKKLNEKNEQYKVDIGAVFAQDMKKNIREVCEKRIFNTFSYLKNEFPKLKVDGYVNQRYANAAEMLEWLNALAGMENIDLYQLLKKQKILGSEGEYKVMLYKIYDRASRSELINSVRSIEIALRKGGSIYDDVLKSITNAEKYAGKACLVKRSSISPDIKKHMVSVYDKSAKVHHKKLLRYDKEYDLQTYEGFAKAKKDLDIIELCKKSIEELTKKEYDFEGLKNIREAIKTGWMSSADNYTREIDQLQRKLLTVGGNYVITYEGVKKAENDFERLKMSKKDMELFSGKEYPIKAEEIEEEIKKLKLKVAPQYDKTAREIYAKLAKYSENYNLDAGEGRESAKADVKKLEETQIMIEELTGKEYPIKGIETIKDIIKKKEEPKPEPIPREQVIPREEKRPAAPKRKSKEEEDYGIDQDDFMSRMFKEKFGM